MSDELKNRIAAQLCVVVHPSVAAFAKRLAENAGARAALFYGSNLRTGELDGVLDFYLLMPGPQKERIWPLVSYHEWRHDGADLRAKAATMSLEKFAQAASGSSRDTTIWARFVQPSAMVWHADEVAREEAIEAIGGAAKTAARLAAALGPDCGSEAEYWRALFQATYKAEFRVEKAGREDSILKLNRAHFDGLLPAALAAQEVEFTETAQQICVNRAPEWRRAIVSWWDKRRRFGKPLNILRLFKASTTFEGAGRYAAWKIERHTGVPIEVTPWREKHPILAAPGVLFKVWRSRRGK